MCRVRRRALRLPAKRFAEDAQEVPAADLSDFIRREAGSQQRIGNHVVKSGRLILPCLVGAFAKAPIRLPASPAASRAATRLRELRVRPDAYIIDSDHIDQSSDVVRIFQGVSAKCVHTPTAPPSLAMVLACSLEISLARILRSDIVSTRAKLVPAKKTWRHCWVVERGWPIASW